ncbi:MAG: adenosylcobinamide amidohydrolase [Candidatus Rokubacteria bacterium]|nr:adenosylcobinamide amidohydrolase [Candidatus Rokubacteria bacterium]
MNGIAGVAIDVGREAVWVRGDTPLGVVSSALVGGNLRTARHIVNMHVAAGYRGERPAEDLEAFAGHLGIREPFVGLMTAARTHEAAVASEADGDAVVTAVVTVGLGSPVAAGVSPPGPWRPSTINTIVLLDARLGPSAAVNAVITATEAKVGALTEAGVLTPVGIRATGTVTDAVVVAWTGRGPRFDYLGPAAPGGWLVARAVRRAVAEGIERA